MKPEEINILLQKFYDGETTPNEEMLIRTEFNANDAESLSQATAVYLKYVQEMQQINLPDSFDEKLIAEISHEPPKFLKLNRFYYASAAIAASILLLIGINMFSNKETHNDLTVQTQYDITKNALLLVSENLNKGFEQLEQINKINQNFEKLNKLKLLQQIQFSDTESETIKGKSL